MQEGLTLPIICEAGLCIFAQKFANLKILIKHPHLQDEEKLLWLWLATTKANNLSFSCSINYRQLSDALNLPLRVVHRALFRLMLMGFINSAISIHYGEPTPEMVSQMRPLELLLPPKPIILTKNEEEDRSWPIRDKKHFQTNTESDTSAKQHKEENHVKQPKRLSLISILIRIKKHIKLICKFLNYRKKLWRLFLN